MTQTEALKLALEALEVIYDRAVFDYSLPADHFAAEGAQEAITAIKEALRERAMYEVQRLGQEIQPEQEPVATVAEVHMSRYTIEWTNGPLPEGTKLYTTPPQRTWVGLTNNELQPICDEYRIIFGSWAEDFARAIEAKLKEKNT